WRGGRKGGPAPPSDPSHVSRRHALHARGAGHAGSVGASGHPGASGGSVPGRAVTRSATVFAAAAASAPACAAGRPSRRLAQPFSLRPGLLDDVRRHRELLVALAAYARLRPHVARGPPREDAP